MRLKRLEMIGFKSFAQRTVVEMNPGITAVVGPNGCGKSNIVDALRWAMGEQSARHLRGHQMEDVVFNGSDNLPATGMAEVSIIFDNEDGRGPAEYGNFSEIMVTRRLFRSGESEYAINKVNCRLKDVVELFLGTGVGSKAYAIVEQGKVDELVNSKPEERRGLIEEAAGTSKYKSRKLVAEKKLERTQQNLLRMNDIVREIERQIRTMELQARKAERYRAVKAELKEKELAFAFLQREAFNEVITGQESQLAGVENRLAEHLAALHGKEAEGEALQLSLMETDREIGVQQENVYQRRAAIQSAEQKCEFYHKDLTQLAQSEAETRASLGQLEERAKLLTREIDELNNAKESFIQLSLFEQTFLREKENELENLQARIRALQAELDQEKTALIDVANQIANLKNETLAAQRRHEEITQALARSRAEIEQTSAALADCEAKQSESARSLTICADEVRERTIEAAAVIATSQSLSRSRQEQENKISSLKEQIQENRSRLRSFEELQKNYEGYQEGVRAIMLKKQQSAPNGIYGLVAEVIEAPETYEKALTAVLGDRLQYVIVKSHQEGLEAIEYLKEQASGRGSFIPMEMSRKPHQDLPLGEAEVVAPLMEMISVKPGYREVAEYLLSDVMVVQNLEAGLALWNRNGYHSTLVTTDGEVIDPIGTVTGGSGAPLERSFLTQRRRIREVGILISEREAELSREEREGETLKRELDQAETKKTLLGAEIHRLELERVRLEHENRAADQEHERLTAALRALSQEQGDLNRTVQLIADEIERCQRQAQARAEEKAVGEQALGQKQTEFAEVGRALETAEAAVTQSRIRNAALGEKRDNTHVNLTNRVKLQQETTQEIAARQAQIADFQRRRLELEQALVQIDQSLRHDRGELQQLEERLQADRQKYREISMRVAEIGETVKELRSLTDACQQEKTRIQLTLAEQRLELQHLAANLREKYDTTLDSLAPAFSENRPSQAELTAEIDELRGRLERMGEVNLAAIGEYEELTERFRFMSQQKEDLEKSMADLQQTIVKLNRICRLRFKESFEAINEKFETIFPRLFRGGKAKLVLTDENDYLETGVDIIVQPPGKKLQSITLLSGGEKALTAVSLLFAIFLTKPSPFCFLDEVDAPLDDANIDRFTEMIKEMSEHSQFVLVTHNKKSMQAAEMLYGITMAEPGVSKVVSVRMN
jgi:chromosome segregation protein